MADMRDFSRLMPGDELFPCIYGALARWRHAPGFCPLWSKVSQDRARQHAHRGGQLTMACFEGRGIQLVLVNDDGTTEPAPKTPDAFPLEGVALFTVDGWDEWGYPTSVSELAADEMLPRDALLMRQDDAPEAYVVQWQRENCGFGAYCHNGKRLVPVPPLPVLYPGDDDAVWARLSCRVEDAEKVSAILGWAEYGSDTDCLDDARY